MVWTSILLAAVFLYLAVRRLDWTNFAAILGKADYKYLPILLIWGSLPHWIRANRWKLLLTAQKYIPTGHVFWANMAGYLGNSVLPARAGELIRATYISKENNLSVAYALTTGLVERFIDLVALVTLGSIALAIARILSDPLQNAIRVMSGIAIVGIIVLLALPYFGSGFYQAFTALPVLSIPVKEKIGGLLEQFLHGVKEIGRASCRERV